MSRPYGTIKCIREYITILGFLKVGSFNIDEALYCDAFTIFKSVHGFWYWLGLVNIRSMATHKILSRFIDIAICTTCYVINVKIE